MISFAEWFEKDQEILEFFELIIESNGELNEGMIKDFWNKHKKKIKYGTLGAAAVAALLTYGIPLSSILPYVAMGVTQSAVHQAMNDIVHPNANMNKQMNLPQTKQSESEQPFRILTDEKNVYVQNPQSGRLEPSNLDNISKMVSSFSGSGKEIIVYRTESSRPSMEMGVKNVLDKVADPNSWRFSDQLQPPLMPEPEPWKPDLTDISNSPTGF